jgi:hypothetical protein
MRRFVYILLQAFLRPFPLRDIAYQDNLLSAVVPGWPDDVHIYYNADRDIMFRPSRRRGTDDIFTASIALLGDTEKEIREVVSLANAKRAQIRDVEAGEIWGPCIAASRFVKAWREARKRGAYMRGAIKSAQTKKAATAAKLESIRHELESTDIPTAVLLARVGVSRNSIKNHFGLCREEMRRKYEITQKRKARREAGRV